MGLSLLFGVIGYLIIIFFLTIWLTKYHTDHCRVLEQESGSEKKEEECVRGKVTLGKGISAEDSQTTPPSGNESLLEDDRGGV